MSTFVDLHCHILPCLDDGPTELETAVELVRGLEALGFEEFFPTPHQKAGFWAPSPLEVIRAAEELQEALDHAGSRARLHPPAGENMWDELFLQRQDGSFPTYPGGKAFLIEFPHDSMPPDISAKLFGFRVGGKLPVVAHVERYLEIERDVRRAEALARTAALLVNLSSLGGIGGWGNRRLARRLVKRGLVHAISTDIHTPDEIRFCDAGAQWVRSHLGEETLNRLLSDNPRRIIAGELPE